MTRPEFAAVMAMIGAGIGKPLSDEGHEVYFACLGDLPLDVLQTAARRVLLEHRWATFPQIAELREAAAATTRGVVSELSPAEAWSIAWDSVSRIDPEQDGSLERGLAGVPSVVVETINAMGVPALCYGKEPVGVVRGQFLKMYEQIAAREKRTALMPASIKRELSDRKSGEYESPLRAILGEIGTGGAE